MKLLVFLLSFSLAFSITAMAQLIVAANKTKAISHKKFFTTEQPFEMTLVSDFKKIRSDKKKDEILKGFITVYLSAKDSTVQEIQINARGQYRRQVCQMPSMMINFKSQHSPFLGSLKKLKLVCGCSASSFDEELVLMEYLTYKIYNFLTDMSFRVRLVKINYKDVNNKMKPYTQYGFFMENIGDLAKRNACKEYQYKAASQIINRTQMTSVALFEYMIGNTDWSIPNYHNIKLIRSTADTNSTPYAVPYDFDFAGIIDAPYAFPNEAFPIERVTDRLYRGFARTYEELETALKIFRDKKAEVYTLLANFSPLKTKLREKMTKYLDGFYSIIEDKKTVKHTFVDGAWKE